jgi:hypothetical protein
MAGLTDRLAGVMNDPMFHLGVGLLSQNTGPGAIGRGLLSGAQQYQQAQQLQQSIGQQKALNAFREMQMEQSRAKMEAEREKLTARQGLLSSLPESERTYAALDPGAYVKAKLQRDKGPNLPWYVQADESGAPTGIHPLYQQVQAMNPLTQIAFANLGLRQQEVNKPRPGQIVQTPTGPQLVDTTKGTAEPIVGPTGEQLPPELKELPQGATEGYLGNLESIRNIDAAIKSLEENPEALGFKNIFVPDAIMQRLDAEGVDPRARVSDIANIRLHDLSGAAVTVGEAARFKPSLPNLSDSPAVAKRKLQNLRQQFEDKQKDFKKFYSDRYRLPEVGADPIANAISNPKVSVDFSRPLTPQELNMLPPEDRANIESATKSTAKAKKWKIDANGNPYLAE